MLGRRTVAVVALAAATAFGGGAAVAATHGSSHQTKRPRPAAETPRENPASNVHYACHDHGVRNPQV